MFSTLYVPLQEESERALLSSGNPVGKALVSSQIWIDEEECTWSQPRLVAAVTFDLIIYLD